MMLEEKCPLEFDDYDLAETYADMYSRVFARRVAIIDREKKLAGLYINAERDVQIVVKDWTVPTPFDTLIWEIADEQV
ncbi:MAG: hypothetical protein ISN29_09665 [Gammaproteobacteria bacterium AqS3]|nr:hypothetical protein [Gammaproteobacteria bacterium AqS3]